MYNSVVKAFKTHKLTPEFCMGVLSRTNVPAVMKEMLEKTGWLPKDLDVSMCGEVKMNNSGIYNVKELRFKNKRQMIDSEVEIPKSWKGKIIYTEDLWGRFKHWCKEK